MELVKLLLAPRAAAALAAMAQAGILDSVLGGETDLASFEAMTKAEAACGFVPDAARRLGALCASSPEDAERLWQRLRLSNAEHQTLAAMAEGWREVSPAMGEDAARVLIYRIGAEHFAARALLAWSRSRAGAEDKGWRELVTLPQRWSAPAFPLRAADFIARGVEKGPSLGAALARAEAAWVAQDFPMDRKALNAILNEALGG
jgi:tRNA nucleotidyltransferase/poly(A) polymerase